MKKKKKREPKEKNTKNSALPNPKNPSLKDETAASVLIIVFFVLGIFFLLAAFEKGGVVGRETYNILGYLLGVGYFILPILSFVLGVSFFKSLKPTFVWTRIVGSILFLCSGLGMTNILFTDRGGIIGNLISSPLVRLFDVYASLVFLVAIFSISLLIILDTKLTKEMFFFWKRSKEEGEQDGNLVFTIPETSLRTETPPETAKVKTAEPEAQQETIKPAEEKNIFGMAKKPKVEDFGISFAASALSTFTPPPLSLLETDKGKPGVGDIKANANIIKRTLQNFGINVEMDEISIGPSVTRYSLKPAEGVKLSRIVGLQSNLELALAAHPLRIEAPIPGKSLVGIEIPNSTKTTVGLASLLGTEEYQTSPKPLLVSLGKGISGKSHFANLAKMPHLLIAGATGSGKSVTIHAIITSLLFRNSPDAMKFIMIDPKRVELTLYNKIPHLLTPVITDAKKTILALKWAAKEMDRRYDILEAESVRDIESYHTNILGPAVKKAVKNPQEVKEGAMPETMPYIVIIIDELADIMQTYPRELESAIVRLAQMSRAVGIHLILSTQRPSVNVITGLIKANIPARIALQVASQIDSRTILDASGAEKLLGAGDMLYLSGEMSKPQRLQSAFISENEVKKVVSHLSAAHKDDLPSELNLTAVETMDNTSIFEATLDGDSDDDVMYEEAREAVIAAGKASTSYLQRKLKLGYARAARLMDMLEERGVIGPGDGAKPREVLIKAHEGSSASAQEGSLL